MDGFWADELAAADVDGHVARAAAADPEPSNSVITSIARAGETVVFTNTECAFPHRHSRFKERPDRYVLLRDHFEPEDADGLSAPIKYPETARALGIEAGDRVPLVATRETVLQPRAGKGMVLNPAEHDERHRLSFSPTENPVSLMPSQVAVLP
ncbi:hypothetical protein GCM10009787_19460 [Streptomyces bangladeshensis]|uniref:Molybdopterin dinucleotide-binding domain-containing protein n=1 Tax=Streptomyces bangladeshensis TaxID=295352 RepID=A0ABN3BGC1_9ACTN